MVKKKKVVRRKGLKPGERNAAVKAVVGQQSAGVVYVSYNMQDHPLNIVGLTVAEARKSLKTPYNIADEETAVVNGNEASPEYELKADDRLEFVKLGGAKG